LNTTKAETGIESALKTAEMDHYCGIWPLI